MERFIVSARKYRPQNFSTVVGQVHITTTLINSVKNNQLAHAFLFCGPRGVGKTTCARILGKTINCANRTAAGEACNVCPSCVSFNEGSSLNIHELDAASNNSVDDIRTLVEQVRFAPQAGKYKVYIIDEVHMLSSSAFNAFLKTLEEPPPYAIFILATTEKYKILPTILSRCQIFDFKRITTKDTVAHLHEICLKEDIQADKPSLQVIAQKSEGCMRDALSILDKIVSFTNGQVRYEDVLEHLNILDEDYYFRLMEAMQGQQLAEAMLLFDDINKKGFEGEVVLNGFSEFIRNILVSQDAKSAALLDVVENFRNKYLALAKKVNSAYLIGALNLLSEAELGYKSARNKRLHVELALIKLCYLRQAVELVTLGNQVGAEKKIGQGAKPLAFRNIPPIQPYLKDSGETKSLPAFNNDLPAAKLMVDVPAVPAIAAAEAPKTVAQPQPNAAADMPTLGALSKIRQQFAARQQTDHLAMQPLQVDRLLEAWQAYTSKLKGTKSSATQSFQRATLNILRGDYFEVSTNNNLEQKFIEQEKRNLTDYLQDFFHNKALSFTVVTAAASPSEPTGERTLTKREQFLQIAEHYPLIKELKDKLKLELDY